MQKSRAKAGDRMEQEEIAFHERVREAYLAIARKTQPHDCPRCHTKYRCPPGTDSPGNETYPLILCSAL